MEPLVDNRGAWLRLAFRIEISVIEAPNNLGSISIPDLGRKIQSASGCTEKGHEQSKTDVRRRHKSSFDTITFSSSPFPRP